MESNFSTEIFVSRIKAALQDKNISQRQLAEKCGITEATLSRYLNGERMPKLEQLFDFAKALGISSDYLLGLSNSSSFSEDKLLTQLYAECESRADEWHQYMINALQKNERNRLPRFCL